VTEPRPRAQGTSFPPIYTESDFDFIDAGIRREVMILSQNGIETFESCEGGPGHTFPEPTIRFCGDRAAGFKALAIAFTYGLQPHALRRCYAVIDGEPVGPDWEMTFSKPDLPSWYEWSKGKCA
jgi:hypothetical protein